MVQSDWDVRRHCRGFWERLSALHWVWGCADTRPGAARGIPRPWGRAAYWWRAPVREARSKGWREMGPEDIFLLSWTWRWAAPGLPVLRTQNLSFYYCKLDLGFLLQKLLVTTSAAFLRFWVTFRRDLAKSEDLQPVHPMTGPGSWEAWWEGLGMSCFENRRAGGWKLPSDVQMSRGKGNPFVVCGSRWFQNWNPHVPCSRRHRSAGYKEGSSDCLSCSTVEAANAGSNVRVQNSNRSWMLSITTFRGRLGYMISLFLPVVK